MTSIQDSLLGEIVGRLRNAFDPDRIILFGSHAWGAPGEGSDIDLLVLIPVSDLSPAKRATLASRCLRGVKAPTDVLVRTRHEMDRLVRVPASLEAEILERGRVIYGRGEEGTGPWLAHQGVA